MSRRPAIRIPGVLRPIVTKHVYPPIPCRSHDWSATFEDYDLGDLTGHGATEQAAIDDLLEQLEPEL